MDRTKAIELLNKALGCVQTDPRNCGKCKECKNYATKEDGIEALSMAISALKQAPTALDHIHNVVAENEYKRGYEQGKADANRPEIPDSWIPFTADTMPKEDGEYFVLYDDKYAEDYDTGRVGVADFYVDCEAFGYWQESYDPVTLGFVDSDFVEIKVKKWMPIPIEE